MAVPGLRAGARTETNPRPLAQGEAMFDDRPEAIRSIAFSQR